MTRLKLLAAVLLTPLATMAQTDDSLKTASLSDVMVTARRIGTSRMGGVANGVSINREELFRAACCNLGESFTTNPSVDVSYSDAATGAKQIKLLGLSGTYVQMLTENMPNFRGAALPYALGYVSGPWMQSIQVSKGASSVRNGYESTTGQINIEYLKPEDEEGATINIYGNSKSRTEANAEANIHLGKMNTELLAHYENDWGHHDDNHDGFYDQPNVRQINLQNRWDYIGRQYIFHGGVAIMQERRTSGQLEHAAHLAPTANPLYTIGIETQRYEAYMKHAFILNPEHGTNIALMASGTLHDVDAHYGNKTFATDETNAYAQLMIETNVTDQHNISAGLSLNYDNIPLTYNATEIPSENETTPGLYAQYTYTLGTHLTLMAGLRADHSSRYGWFATPRVHIKYMPHEVLTLRLSAGKGYRTPHALAENHYLLASGRRLITDELEQERAWNYGMSVAFTLPLGQKSLKLNAEYYYTHFISQMLIDYDSNPQEIRLCNLHGRSRSHTFQVDATYPLVEGLELTAAYRMNDVRATYGGQLLEKPLQSRYKALLVASYKVPPGLWQMDITFQQNGGGRLPSGLGRFSAYPQLNAQLTRWFRHCSVYLGGENLTNYRQPTPIMGADQPWSSLFEPTMVWGPVHGITLYAGLRLNLGKRL